MLVLGEVEDRKKPSSSLFLNRIVFAGIMVVVFITFVGYLIKGLEIMNRKNLDGQGILERMQQPRRIPGIKGLNTVEEITFWSYRKNVPQLSEHTMEAITRIFDINFLTVIKKLLENSTVETLSNNPDYLVFVHVLSVLENFNIEKLFAFGNALSILLSLVSIIIFSTTSGFLFLERKLSEITTYLRISRYPLLEETIFASVIPVIIFLMIEFIMWHLVVDEAEAATKVLVSLCCYVFFNLVLISFMRKFPTYKRFLKVSGALIACIALICFVLRYCIESSKYIAMIMIVGRHIGLFLTPFFLTAVLYGWFIFESNFTDKFLKGGFLLWNKKGSREYERDKNHSFKMKLMVFSVLVAPIVWIIWTPIYNFLWEKYVGEGFLRIHRAENSKVIAILKELKLWKGAGETIGGDVDCYRNIFNIPQS